MFNDKFMLFSNGMLLAAVLASAILVSAEDAQRTVPLQSTVAAAAKPAVTAGPAYHYQPNRVSKRAGLYYELIWGVDSLGVKWAESGELVRFSYRVLDGSKAKPLNDKKSEPSLEDPRAGLKLVVPQLEFVGKMRNTLDPEAGKSYWVVFSNKGRLVKRGDHVNVSIGKFRADGLVVE
jgi:hypothetical protein